MIDEILGTLARDDAEAGALRGAIVYEGNEVALFIYSDSEGLSACLALARAAVSSISAIDAKARSAAANELLATHNESWRDYQEPDENGVYRETSNPEVTASEFKARLSLGSLSVRSKTSCCLGYDDGDLFWGHGILVTSSDGVEFTNVEVELYG